jgi:hypothetical protein
LKREGMMRVSLTPSVHANDPLEVPITRARAKKLKKALNGLVQNM